MMTTLRRFLDFFLRAFSGLGNFLRNRIGLRLLIGMVLGGLITLTILIAISSGVDLADWVTAQIRPATGDIIVETPQVYTRQRLVNDRLEQSTWLQAQLALTEADHADTFRSLEGIARIADSTKVGFEAAAGRTAGEGRPATSETPGNSSASPLDIPATTLDTFHAMNSFRDEVRAELMSTQLDDRHDIEGNTIYRFTFDTTVLSPRTNHDLAIVEMRWCTTPISIRVITRACTMSGSPRSYSRLSLNLWMT
jgi:hypothetical protein